MVAIFTQTSSTLSLDFISKFSAEKLALSLMKVRLETGVEVNRQETTYAIVGQWSEMIKAHRSLEILFENEDFQKVNYVSDRTYGKATPMKKVYASFGSKPGRRPGITVKKRCEYSVEAPIVTYGEHPFSQVLFNSIKTQKTLDTVSNLQMSVKDSGNQNELCADIGIKDVPEIKVEIIDESCIQESYDGDTDVDEEYVNQEVKSDPSFGKDIDKTCRNSSNQTEEQSNIINIKVENETEINIENQANSKDMCKQINYVSSKTEDEVLRSDLKFASTTKGKESPAIMSKEMLNAPSVNKMNEKKEENLNNGMKTFGCDLCSYLGAKKENLKEHVKRNHRKKFACDICQRQFGVNKDLNRHKRQVHLVFAPSHSSEVHNQVNKSPPKYNEHSETNPEFPCDSCNYIGAKKENLKEHFKRNHRLKFTCDVCQKQFGFNKDLNRHKRQVHSEPSHFCEVCNKFYKSKRAYDEHVQTHQEDYVKPSFACELCKKSFCTKYVLGTHVKAEHQGMKKSYMCPTCGRTFTQKSTYIMHANAHAGIKPYVCDVCGKAFTYDKSLREHKYLHDTTQRFQCHICPKTFQKDANLRVHLRVHKKTKDYMCTFCAKGFTQKQALLRHERIHSGDKPFVCRLCERSFSDYSIIRRHMLLIHKKDPKDWRGDMISKLKRHKGFFIELKTDHHVGDQTSSNDLKQSDTVDDTGKSLQVASLEKKANDVETMYGGLENFESDGGQLQSSECGHIK